MSWQVRSWLLGASFHEEKDRVEVRSIYKFPRARASYDTLRSSYSLKGVHELLGTGLEFTDLGMVKSRAKLCCPLHGRSVRYVRRATFEKL